MSSSSGAFKVIIGETESFDDEPKRPLQRLRRATETFEDDARPATTTSSANGVFLDGDDEGELLEEPITRGEVEGRRKRVVFTNGGHDDGSEPDDDSEHDDDEGDESPLVDSENEIPARKKRPPVRPNLARNSNPSRFAKQAAEFAAKNEELAKDIVRYWTAELNVLVLRRMAITEAISTSKSDLELVKRVSSAVRKYDKVVDLPDDDELWEHLNSKPESIPILADIARHPNSPPPESPHVVLRPKEDVDKNTADFYSRWVAIDNPISCFRQYLHENPDETAFMVFRLIALRDNLEDLEKEFRLKMDGLLHASVVPSFFRMLRKTRSEKVIHERTPPPNGTHYEWYDGMTIAVNGEIRVDQDLQNAMYTRWSTFIKLNGDRLKSPPTSVTHKLLLVEDVDTLRARARSLLSHIEGLLIDLRGGLGLNTARGGIMPEYKPYPKDASVINKALSAELVKSAALLGCGESVDAELIGKVTNLFKSELDLLHAHYPNKKTICSKAMDLVIRNGAEVLRTVNGVVPGVVIPKDITVEEFTHSVGGFWGEYAGLAFWEHRWIHHLINPRIPLVGGIPFDIVSHFLGAYMDFWALVLIHLLFIAHCLFLSQRLRMMQVLTIVVFSNSVSAALHQCYLSTAWDYINNADTRTTLESGQLPPNLIDNLHEFHRRQPRFLGDEYYSMLGKLELVPFGPGVDEFAVMMVQGHPGRFKYDFSIGRRLRRLHYLLLAKAVVLRQAAVLTLKNEPNRTRAEHCAAVMDITQHICTESGLEASIAEAKSEVRRTELVVLHCRGLPERERTRKERQEVSIKAAVEGQPIEGRICAEMDVERAEGAPESEARARQVARFVREMSVKVNFGRLEDPIWYLVPFWMKGDIDECEEYLMQVSEGISFSHSARTKGSDEASYQRVLHNNGRTRRLKAQQETRDPETNLDKKMVTERETQREVGSAGILDLKLPRIHPKIAERKNQKLTYREHYRSGRCNDCRRMIFECTVKATHRCEELADEDIEFTHENFSDMKLHFYVHDLLSDRGVVGIISGLDTSDDASYKAALHQILSNSNYGLTRMSMETIVRQNRQLLINALAPFSSHSRSRVDSDLANLLDPASKFSEGYIYLPDGLSEDKTLELTITLAIDLMLQTSSSCVDPQFEAGLTFEQRYHCWVNKGEKWKDWLERLRKHPNPSVGSDARLLHCNHGGRHLCFSVRGSENAGFWREHDCNVTEKRVADAKEHYGDPKLHPDYNRRRGIKDCDTASFFKCCSLWELPSTWARRCWHLIRVKEVAAGWNGVDVVRGAQHRETRVKTAERKKDETADL